MAGRAEAIFYWRPRCGFCMSLRSQLERAGVPIEERNIWESEEDAAFVRSVARGNETVPTVVVRGKALVNPSAREVVELLEQTA
jgi:glutaredoxin